ncbi:MAG: NAD-binding protein [Chloroflexota bacterium]
MSESRGHVILCGLEGLSIRTLEELDRLGERVVAIAPPDVEPRYRELAAAAASRVVDGDPRDPTVLREAGVQRARALVLSANDDVGNIHVALVATGINPGLHLVVRTFDEEFGRRVESLVPQAVALSASALAAPGFVSAILDERDQRVIEVAGRTFALATADPTHPATAVVLVDDRLDPPVVLPDPATLAPGALPALVESEAVEEAPLPAGKRRRRRRRWRDPVRALRHVDRRFWILGAVLAAITFGSAIVFELAKGISPVDAIYSTVAGFFGGVVDANTADTPELKVFAVVLTFVGAAALALFYGLIADVVLSARMRDVLGPRPTDAEDHVIVVGLGTIGIRICRALVAADVPVVAADQRADGRFLDDAAALGIPVVIGDAGGPGLLRSLGIEKARALAVVTDSDAANLATALHARGLREDLRIVVRLFDPELAAQLERALGSYHSRSVSTLAAPVFAAAAVDRKVVATIPVGHRRVVAVTRCTIAAGSRADGSTVGDETAAAAAVAQGGARVLGVGRGDDVTWKPDPGMKLEAGDELILVAPRRSLAVALARASAHRPDREHPRGAADAEPATDPRPEPIEA